MQEIRAFASRELGLPDNASYTRYTDLGRPFVVWNVFATPELSLKPRQWCFPGRRLRQLPRLLQRGGGARRGGAPRGCRRRRVAWAACPRTRRSASSTIRCCRRSSAGPRSKSRGWCSTSSRTRSSTSKDDTQFNESFAVAVEEAGVARWLAAQGNPQLDAQFARSERLRAAFRDLIARRARAARPRSTRATRATPTSARARREAFAGDARRATSARRPASPASPASTAGSPATATPAPTTRASRRSALYYGPGARRSARCWRRRAATCRASTRGSRSWRRCPRPSATPCWPGGAAPGRGAPRRPPQPLHCSTVAASRRRRSRHAMP